MNKKLTADQVCKCALVVYYEGYNDGYLNRDCHFEETDWQAITDELNSQIEITEQEWIEVECAKCGARENERDSDFKELETKVDELINELYRYKLQCARYEEKIDELTSLVWERRLK